MKKSNIYVQGREDIKEKWSNKLAKTKKFLINKLGPNWVFFMSFFNWYEFILVLIT